MERQLEYVLRTVEERGVRFVRLWFTDVLGFLKSVEITPAELEVALEEGMTFDGSTIEGYSRIQESDMLARPDPNTFELLPLATTTPPSPACSATSRCSRASPFHGDPRHVLKRNLERAREKGFTFFVGPGDGVLLLPHRRQRSSPSTTPATSTSPPTTSARSLRKQTVLRLEAMGIPVEYSFHENGPSQHEIDLRYTDALTMADNVMTFRLIAKEVAADYGVYATFMPKPIAGAFGSGMHSHLSLFEGDVNAFHDPGDEYGLSKVAKHFIAGLLVHASEIVRHHEPVGELVQAADPRLRSAGLQVLGAQQSLGARARSAVEERQGRIGARSSSVPPIPACNPYLVVLGDAGRRA